LIIKADAIIIGAPLYFRGAPTKFQTLIEKIISIFFYYETNGKAINKSPVKDKPCGLIGMAEYSNPHQILEYLHDFCCLLNMKAIKIEKFPYIGVCGQGDINKDKIFNPFERSKDLANAIIKEWKSNE
jgi:multimeric flavodoxin WrbA